MGDLFNSPVLRVEQPRKVVQTQTQYSFSDDKGTLLAVATDVEMHSRREAVRAVLPQHVPTALTLVLRDAAEVPLLVLARKDNFYTEIRRPAVEGQAADEGELIGSISSTSTKRQYALEDADGHQLGLAVGDLKLRRFVVTNGRNRKVARIEKKWAGLRAEFFTNADRYTVEITGEVDEALRTLIVVSAVVLDLTAYETKDVV